MTNETFTLFRIYKSMGQQEFADHIGVSKATVSMIELNQRPVTRNVQGKLAAKFDLNDEGFFKFKEKYRILSQ